MTESQRELPAIPGQVGLPGPAPEGRGGGGAEHLQLPGRQREQRL